MRTATQILLVTLLGLLLGAFAASEVRAHPGIDEQIRSLNEQIRADPTDARLFLRRGELQRIHRNWTRAEADYRRARKLDPELILVEERLGRLYLESGHPEKATKALERYLERRPHDTDALVTLGRALAEQGRHLEAAQSFTRALASVRDGRPRPEYYLERARALDAAGREHLEAALDGLDEGLTQLGHPVTLQLFAIELELKARRYDEALERLSQIAAQSARQETWLVRRGEILELAGRYDDARKAYGKTIEAIEKLPPSRRGNRAVERLETQARAALERLDVKAAKAARHDVEGAAGGKTEQR